MRVLSISVRGLEMPVDECPSSARGACPFLCPWSALCFCLLHMYNRTILYCSTVGTKNDDHHHEPRTKLERGSGSTLRSLLRYISAEHTPGGQRDRAACTGTNKGLKVSR